MNREQYGLMTERSVAIPLTGVKVDANITGRAARVTIKQQFTNVEDNSIEAIYKFPLPENSSICAFRGVIGDRIIKGKIEEREKAFRDYDEALVKGHRAFLMDEERPNIFTLSAGNMKPHSSATIEIDYVTLLDTNEGEVRFFLSTTISPRYVPDSMQDKNGIPQDDIVNPPISLTVPYGLSINLDIQQVRDILSIESPSHQIKTSFETNIMKVEFSNDIVAMDRDFIINIKYKNGFENKAFSYHDDENTFVQVDFNPELKEINSREEVPANGSKKEIVFVLDCSGSMQGSSIAEAKKALEVFLKGLKPGFSFNIYRFGSSYESLFAKSVSYDSRNLTKVLGYLSTIDADLGGTEMFSPLQEIYRQNVAQGRKRSIVLITDGQVGNDEQIIQMAKGSVDSTALFAVGVGYGPNEFFIRQVSRISGGASEMISTGERIEPRVLRLFNKVVSERINDLKISWGRNAEQSPLNPVVFNGETISLFARVKNVSDLAEKLMISGKTGNMNREWNIRKPVVADGIAIPVLWAREKIRDIEEGNTETKVSRQLHRKEQLTRETAIELSMKYGLLCGETSFVAVETRQDAEKQSGEIVLRKVPAMLTKGWGGLGRYPTQVHSYRQVRTVQTMENFARVELTVPPCYRKSHAPLRAIPRFYTSSPIPNHHLRARTDDPAVYEQKFNADDILLHILSLQKANGGFKIDRVLAQFLKCTLTELKNQSSNIVARGRVNRFVLLSTAIVLHLLETRFVSSDSTWRSIVDKSQQWLKDKVLLNSPVIEEHTLADWVDDFVSEKS